MDPLGSLSFFLLFIFSLFTRFFLFLENSLSCKVAWNFSIWIFFSELMSNFVKFSDLLVQLLFVLWVNSCRFWRFAWAWLAGLGDGSWFGYCWSVGLSFKSGWLWVSFGSIISHFFGQFFLNHVHGFSFGIFLFCDRFGFVKGNIFACTGSWLPSMVMLLVMSLIDFLEYLIKDLFRCCR